ncbi:MAG: family 78 glycoside hydrolase catalytic domain [Oscillospiraceae bacterium]|nr:family 78 glycoside hydrolase catalytic domain [Oscillospiraceae bacterium]
MQPLNACWMTIPQWPKAPVRNVFHREQEPMPVPDDRLPKNVHVLVRAVLDLPAGPCSLYLSADDYYHARLDGCWLGCGPAPGYPSRYYYQRYSAEGGRRAVLSLHIYYQGLINRVWNSGDGRFGFFLRVESPAGEVLPVSLRCSLCHAYSGETTGYDTQFLEDFDSRLWPEGWELPAFDDSGWEAPVRAEWADYRMLPQPIENLQWESLLPVSVRKAGEGILLDFGRELAGMLCVQAVGAAGQRVTLRFGEELEDETHVRFRMRCNCRYEEHWTLRDGCSALHPFDYKAFRYAYLLPDSGVTITDCRVRARHYPMEEEKCTLHARQDELGAVFRICKNAVRWGTQESYLDCPGREKGQYIGDCVITARSQVWLTGSTRLLRKSIGDFTESLRVSPGMMAVAPGSLMQEIADYSLLFPLLPLTDYEFTGDRSFLKTCYPAVVSVIDAFSAYARNDGLLEDVSMQWNLVDWPENYRDHYDFPLTRPVVGHGCHNVINALWYEAVLSLERIEAILGLPVGNRSVLIAASYRKAFFREGQALFADSETSSHCSLHANLYAACFGLLPDSSADPYEALVLDPGRICGVMPAYFLLKSLARLGKRRTLYRLLTRSDPYGWRNMLREGATACFEAWGKEQKWNTSLCHPWASGPVSLIIEELAGFHPDPDTESGFRFEPDPVCSAILQDFHLKVPFRGNQYRITKNRNGVLDIERMCTNADP